LLLLVACWEVTETGAGEREREGGVRESGRERERVGRKGSASSRERMSEEGGERERG